MKKYDVYGIGAALVDTEVEVSDAFQVGAHINKGVMTLVDEPRQAQLLAALVSQNAHMLRKCVLTCMYVLIKVEPRYSCKTDSRISRI